MFIFFDFDGTLVDIGRRWFEIHQDLTGKYNLPSYEYGDYIKLKRDGMNESDLMKNLSDSNDLIDAYCKERLKVIETREYLKYDEDFPMIFDVLEEWKRLGKMFIVTKRRSREDFLWEAQDDFGEYFDKFIVTEGKSKEEVLSENFSKTELGQSVLITDSFEDYETGKSLGMKVFVVGYGCRSAEYFNRMGITDVVNDCGELKEKAIGFAG